MCGKWIGKHYISTKNKYNYGATSIFSIDKEKWTEEYLKQLIEEAISEKDNRLPAIELRKRKLDALITRQPTIMYYSYGPFSEERCLTLSIVPSPATLFYSHDFGYDNEKIFLIFPTKITEIRLKENVEGGIDRQYFEKIEFYLDLMENVFDHFQCEYAWSDHFDYLMRFEGKDPRQYVFGINYYGKEMVGKIGKETLLSVPDCIVREKDWGGVILQLAENPFLDIDEGHREMVKQHIGL